ncbi:MAG: hypothetical protein KF889_20715 [Alphaproteobacteria bacterium]|nr:hypothetical protein [Alphaproteobacteria bacterium]MCW5744371.1 hypothetical protein [Alphaproteobacteria bacterium]
MFRSEIVFAGLCVLALALSGCAEIGPGGAETKLGIGPFKLFSIEAGPGGLEQKGPSAGPFRFGY